MNKWSVDVGKIDLKKLKGFCKSSNANLNDSHLDHLHVEDKGKLLA